MVTGNKVWKWGSEKDEGGEECKIEDEDDEFDEVNEEESECGGCKG